MINRLAFNNSAFTYLRYLDKIDRKKLTSVVLILSFINLFDLVALAFIGTLSALAITSLESRKPGNRVLQILQILNLENTSLQNILIILGCTAAIIFVLKTIVSLYLNKRILRFLANKSLFLSSKIFQELLTKPINVVNEISRQNLVFTLTQGVETIVVKIIGTLATLISDISLLLLLLIALGIFDFLMAVTCLAYFSLVGIFVYRIFSMTSHRIGLKYSESDVSSQKQILETLENFRTLRVNNTIGNQSLKFNVQRQIALNSSSNLALMPNATKYLYETTLILGCLFIAGIQLVTKDATHAFSTFSIFLVAGTRFAPAALRVQQSLLQLKSSKAIAQKSCEIIDFLLQKSESKVVFIEQNFKMRHENFVPRIKISNISISYSENSKPILESINLDFEANKFIAIVGPSGAGKSTLVDAILGLIKPTEGFIEISGLPPQEAINSWPGAIAYVPQNVSLIMGTVRENICLGFKSSEITDQRIFEVLAKVDFKIQKEEFLGGLDLNSNIGEYSSKISGGQKQRLGIARALISNPKILILDEATSSLDSSSELLITKALESIRKECTIVVVAHRLSTVKSADKLIYVEGGKVLSQGTFDEVRFAVPNFDTQAKLMGL